jgi:hypothetical protein
MAVAGGLDPEADAGQPETVRSPAQEILPAAGELDRGPMSDISIQGGGELRLVDGVDPPGWPHVTPPTNRGKKR